MNILVVLLVIASVVGVIEGISNCEWKTFFPSFLALVFCVIIIIMMVIRIESVPCDRGIMHTSLINGDIATELIEVTRISYNYPWWYLPMTAKPKYYMFIGGVSIEVGIEKRVASAE